MASGATATLEEVLAAFQMAPSVSEKGTKFEKLMVDFFLKDPTFSAQYDSVSRWVDWGHRGAGVDTGIDLVARNRLDGSWTAIQCKFFAPDHYLQKKDIDSFFTASGKTYQGVGFANRIIISTTDKWSKHAEEALEDQTIPVQRIGMADLAAAPIDWAFATPGELDVELTPAKQYKTRSHQDEAISRILDGFQTHDRGQWISACGTGKTFTSLKLAERLAADNDGSLRVLFLAPSIQLVSQTLREWTAQATLDLQPLVVCSDTKASRVAEDITVHDLVLPATTDAAVLHERMQLAKRAKGLRVVFSTYQSIDVVAAAQGLGADEFDLILCDEAHRTTGVTLIDEEASHFVKVHDQSFIKGAKRLYMTATPRVFGEKTKGAAAEHSAELSSMDDAKVFGPVFHRLGFGEAVERDLLTDYKVMVLMVSEDQIAAPLQAYLAREDNEIPLDDAAKIIGCWNGLAKRTKGKEGFPPSAVPMKRAVAFLQNIKSSTRVADAFPEMVEEAEGITARDTLVCDAQHVDGTMNALVRADKLNWLKAPVADGECRILTNARCLSEGVDVPALDAVLFMSPRSSQVDVVQSVGRVMRKAPGKDFGYIILPVAVPPGVEPSKALDDNRRFRVVWEVLNALRSHDDRFDAMVNSIQLNKHSNDKLIFDLVDGRDLDGSDDDSDAQAKAAAQPGLFSLGEWKDSLYAKIVAKVGTREYWDQWAKDVADMSAAQISRINAILAASTQDVQDRFDAFLQGLQGNLNDSITADDAVSMLSQHLITAPVFDALFGASSFATNNPVSVGMQAMLDVLEGQGLEAETEKLNKFYASVQQRAEAVTSAEGRQSLIHDLYEKFFKNAFPLQAEAFGIVYTPVEAVDFIIRAADHLSRKHFGQGLTDEGVNILDPFTGTGTFIVRLLQSGIIQAQDLPRKYSQELWANEIMLLAYYIACVNIEATYESLTGTDDYTPFPGATMTDTFQISEDGDRTDSSLLPANNDRITKQLETPITVILGNPPYSVGQTSANDNNANIKYPTLDARIADTYAKRSTATNKNSLYDSYIRAHRWATDRLQDRGIMAFISNGGWIEGNTADGMRLSMAEDFSHIWVFNLRGNARTAGELRRKEGGNVFESGSRNTVVITLAVKDPDHEGPAVIHYRDIGDYLTREDKLHILTTANLQDDDWQTITPNDDGDWLDQRDVAFSTFIALGTKGDELAIFRDYSGGLKTNRDAWCYNFSRSEVERNMQRMIRNYNATIGSEPKQDSSQISWNRGLLNDHRRGVGHKYRPDAVRISLYRPFIKQNVYFDRAMNDMVYQMPRVFPSVAAENSGFYSLATGSPKPFSVLATDQIPDVALYGSNSGYYFPRWIYEAGPKRAESETLFDETGELFGGLRRVDNVTDHALVLFRGAFGAAVSKDDIFNYAYGLLHSPQYRKRFAADLKKMLPRIPLVRGAEDFKHFTQAGEKLMALHMNYESVRPYPLGEVISAPLTGDEDEYELYCVDKLKFRTKVDRTALVYNKYITLTGIPDEAHDYMLGSKSALDWIIDRYRVKTDKASGIVNDPNEWAREHRQPRYIIDLIKKVTTVSVETARIVKGLPDLPLGQ